MRRLAPLSVLVVVAALVAGCGGETPATGPAGDSTTGSPPTLQMPSVSVPTGPVASATATAGHRGRYVGPLTRSFEYADPGLTLAKPAPSVTPDVPWTVAFDACLSGPLPCVSTGDAVVSLAEVSGPTDALVGGKQMFDRTAAFVVVWDPSPCARRALGRRCREVALVTAKKGAVPAGLHLYTFEIPAAASYPR